MGFLFQQALHYLIDHLHLDERQLIFMITWFIRMWQETQCNNNWQLFFILFTVTNRRHFSKFTPIQSRKTIENMNT